jgi:hypothetical protein
VRPKPHKLDETREVVYGRSQIMTGENKPVRFANPVAQTHTVAR